MLHINMQPDVKKNERDFLNGGLTPLMVAVKHKHVEAVRKMVKLKVKVQISTLSKTVKTMLHELVICSMIRMWTWTPWTVMATVWSSW